MGKNDRLAKPCQKIVEGQWIAMEGLELRLDEIILIDRHK
jgi:hypothetical protein